MALTITVNITDEEQAALEDSILDINQWVQDAVRGKINSCEKRLINTWHPKLMDDPAVTTMPATKPDFISTVRARPDYKSRAERDAES